MTFELDIGGYNLPGRGQLFNNHKIGLLKIIFVVGFVQLEVF